MKTLKYENVVVIVLTLLAIIIPTSGMINVGESKRGTRRIIPIIGGTFCGPKIKGEILPGGDDWQLVRPDGDTELYARYLLKTNDGYIFQIVNQALIHTDNSVNSFYCKSVLDIEVPNNSPYNYLNHADWADAKFETTGVTSLNTYNPISSEPYILTPLPSAKPRINSSKVFGVRPGSPFQYLVAATGDRPMNR